MGRRKTIPGAGRPPKRARTAAKREKKPPAARLVCQATVESTLTVIGHRGTPDDRSRDPLGEFLPLTDFADAFFEATHYLYLKAAAYMRSVMRTEEYQDLLKDQDPFKERAARMLGKKVAATFGAVAKGFVSPCLVLTNKSMFEWKGVVVGKELECFHPNESSDTGGALVLDQEDGAFTFGMGDHLNPTLVEFKVQVVEADVKDFPDQLRDAYDRIAANRREYKDRIAVEPSESSGLPLRVVHFVISVEYCGP